MHVIPCSCTPITRLERTTVIKGTDKNSDCRDPQHFLGTLNLVYSVRSMQWYVNSEHFAWIVHAVWPIQPRFQLNINCILLWTRLQFILLCWHVHVAVSIWSCEHRTSSIFSTRWDTHTHTHTHSHTHTHTLHTHCTHTHTHTHCTQTGTHK